MTEPLTFLMNVFLGGYIVSAVIALVFLMTDSGRHMGHTWAQLDYNDPFHWMPPINVGCFVAFLICAFLSGVGQ